jgi:hypothetical protein
MYFTPSGMSPDGLTSFVGGLAAFVELAGAPELELVLVLDDDFVLPQPAAPIASSAATAAIFVRDNIRPPGRDGSASAAP